MTNSASPLAITEESVGVGARQAILVSVVGQGLLRLAWLERLRGTDKNADNIG